MKTKQKPVKNPPPERKNRKKLRFEDGVRAALIAGVVICAAVLGAGGFFAVRSALFGGEPGQGPGVSPAAGEGESSPEPGPARPDPVQPPVTESPAAGTDPLPELDEAIRSLEAGAGAAGPGSGGTAGAVPPGIVPAQPPRPPNRKGVLALVIDDAGNNLRELDPFLAFPGPLTIAVLPGLPNSVEAARRVRAAGKELFLHQPMEPLNGQDPGPGAIKTGMSPGEVKEILVKNLNEVGPVMGFNNHEGSRATMDPLIMKPLLELSRDSNLCFLDSRTIADTAGPRIARELGIAIAQRDFFLDNEQDRESILAVIEAACKKAEQNGSAVLIGHTWSPRLAAILTEAYPRLVKEGYAFTTISGLLSLGK
ncbi:MAG: divergent polysaccharide deacetylase family protein [Treponema sp.]|nr:divergent polysaccharide deacetylase family protein [Treponema sp.]